MSKVKSTFSPELLKKIEVLLIAEKARLEKEVAKYSKKNKGDDGVFPDYGDKEDENAAEVAEYVVNLSLEESLEKSLRDAVSALERLKKGVYGICKYCQKPIEEKRLLARPTSSSCMSCKKTITQEV
ncbi:MAG: TraR/DksA C4-type zinc finger protein [Candidatus Magasanikbacteria bacterium]|nr:TraR/DksA C4-type zinc finger protein [Candidatus Magasanikbacteria bacterium]